MKDPDLDEALEYEPVKRLSKEHANSCMLDAEILKRGLLANSSLNLSGRGDLIPQPSTMTSLKILTLPSHAYCSFKKQQRPR